jgi:LEA14-like dessication related protein
MIQKTSLKSILLFLLSSALFIVMGVSCSKFTFQQPVVKSLAIRIKGLDRSALVLEGKLEVFNPNELSTRFSGYIFRLDLEGQRVLGGQSDQAFTVPAQETFSVIIPATILFKDLLALSRKELLNRDLKYRIEGSVIVDSGISGLTLPFSSEGTINLSEWVKGQVRDFLGGM